MGFDDLVNWMKGKVAGMQSFQGDNGTWYGPAEARRSRTPITYDSTANGPQAGNYDPGDWLHAKTMTIYPNSRLAKQDGSTSPTIQHEEVHALQDQVGQMGKGGSVPGYADIAHAIGQSVAGSLPTEAPADAISYDPRFTPALSQDTAHAYAQKVIAGTPAPQAAQLQGLEDSAKNRLAINDALLAQRNTR